MPPEICFAKRQITESGGLDFPKPPQRLSRHENRIATRRFFLFAVVRQLSEYITFFGYAVNFPHIEIVVHISGKKSFPCQPALPLYHCHISQAEKPLSVCLYDMCQTVYHSHIPLHHLQLFQTLFLLRRVLIPPPAFLRWGGSVCLKTHLSSDWAKNFPVQM